MRETVEIREEDILHFDYPEITTKDGQNYRVFSTHQTEKVYYCIKIVKNDEKGVKNG